MYKHSLLPALLCISPAIAQTAQAAALDEPWLAAQQQQLAQHPTWLKLGHYEKSTFSSVLASEVTSEHFFLAPTGKTSPADELSATIAAMLHKETQPNVSAQCRFPARKHWLSQMLPGFAQALPTVACPEYAAHAAEHRANSLSLLFASGYLGNPASMYGHLLVKLNNDDKTQLLENTLNYGAMVPPEDNKLKYITWGIFGGYQAQYSSEPFHRHSQIYNENELRDLWEYQLDLTQEEVDFILAHHWEIHDKTFTYYFFKQNCAYHIAKLLELAVDGSLLNTRKPWVMPSDVVAGVAGVNRDQTLAKAIRKHQSRQEAFYQKFHRLNHREQAVAEALAQDIEALNQSAFHNQSTLSQQRIIETLFDYYSFLEVSLDGLDPEQHDAKRKLLAKRFTLPATPVDWKAPAGTPPHEAQFPSFIQLAPTYNSRLGEGVELRYRANYYDLLALDAGRLPFSELSMFDLSLLYRDDQWRLKHWDLFRIQNLNVSSTGLPHDGGNSWTLRVGVANVDFACDDCLVAGISGSLGKSYRLNQESAIYGMLDGKLQAPDRERGHVKAGVSAGLISRVTPYWRTSLAVGYHYYLDNTAQHGHSLAWEQRFGQAKDWDIRTQVSYDGATETSVSYRYYW
ncbi:DUF4105 domain-containing protein [Photobacterium sp. MCCC 1A19761]|uniref:Lnb N-terminal periplasmic domain-containing protein n=1 Tax=Photobacterium sp. MCCC 1A19761 TaxID=3115000 RepID=UPI00307FCB43